MTDPDMKALDALLDQVADQHPDVPDDLMAAVLRDAARMQPAPAAMPARPGVWATVLDMIGGWPAVSGMAAAGIAGVWIGLAPPVALESAAAEMLGTTETVDLFGADLLATFPDAEELQ